MPCTEFRAGERAKHDEEEQRESEKFEEIREKTKMPQPTESEHTDGDGLLGRPPFYIKCRAQV